MVEKNLPAEAEASRVCGLRRPLYSRKYSIRVDTNVSIFGSFCSFLRSWSFLALFSTFSILSVSDVDGWPRSWPCSSVVHTHEQIFFQHFSISVKLSSWALWYFVILTSPFSNSLELCKNYAKILWKIEILNKIKSLFPRVNSSEITLYFVKQAQQFWKEGMPQRVLSAKGIIDR